MGTTLFVMFWLLVAGGAAAYAFSAWLTRATAPDDPMPEDQWHPPEPPAAPKPPPAAPKPVKSEPEKPKATAPVHDFSHILLTGVRGAGTVAEYQKFMQDQEAKLARRKELETDILTRWAQWVSERHQAPPDYISTADDRAQFMLHYREVSDGDAWKLRESHNQLVKTLTRHGAELYPDPAWGIQPGQKPWHKEGKP